MYVWFTGEVVFRVLVCNFHHFVPYVLAQTRTLGWFPNCSKPEPVRASRCKRVEAIM